MAFVYFTEETVNTRDSEQNGNKHSWNLICS